MKNLTNYILIAATAVGLLACSAEAEDGPSLGEVVMFSASTPQTRTAYSADVERQIDWQEGDSVRIYSDLAATAEGENYFDYAINVTGDKAALMYSTSGLRWQDATSAHTFWAVYPAGAKGISVVDGATICQVERRQTCRVSGDDAVAQPDMSLCYMAATKTSVKTDDVEFQFTPLVTTLQVTVNATEAITLTGVSVENPLYDGLTYTSDSETTVEAGSTFIFCKVVDEDGAFVERTSLTLTLFLPYLSTDTELKLRVHTTAGVSKYKTIALKAGACFTSVSLPAYEENDGKKVCGIATVDLGLPSGIKWAAQNLEDYYAWEATEDYSGLAGVDPALGELGVPWRTPTAAEWAELLAYTSASYGQQTVTLTAENGNTLTLPCGGYKKTQDAVATAVNVGYYWSSTPKNATDEKYAINCVLTSSGGTISYALRTRLYLIRAVCD